MNVYPIDKRMVTSQQNNNQNIQLNYGKSRKALCNLQNKLLTVWTQQNIDEYYQSLFLTYIDNLSPTTAMEEMSKQIRLTHEGKTPFFVINETMMERQQIFNAIKTQLETVNLEPEESYFDNLCENIDRLRKYNLLCAEAIIKFFESLCDSDSSAAGEHELNHPLFQIMNDDNQVLKDSILKHYICFKDGYDPFLLYHYELLSKTDDSSLRKNIAIKKLFTMNISYTYRLLKAQHHILKFMSESQKDQNQVQNQKAKALKALRRNSRLSPKRMDTHNISYSFKTDQKPFSFQQQRIREAVAQKQSIKQSVNHKIRLEKHYQSQGVEINRHSQVSTVNVKRKKEPLQCEISTEPHEVTNSVKIRQSDPLSKHKSGAINQQSRHYTQNPDSQQHEREHKFPQIVKKRKPTIEDSRETQRIKKRSIEKYETEEMYQIPQSTNKRTGSQTVIPIKRKKIDCISDEGVRRNKVHSRNCKGSLLAINEKKWNFIVPKSRLGYLADDTSDQDISKERRLKNTSPQYNQQHPNHEQTEITGKLSIRHYKDQRKHQKGHQSYKYHTHIRPQLPNSQYRIQSQEHSSKQLKSSSVEQSQYGSKKYNHKKLDSLNREDDQSNYGHNGEHSLKKRYLLIRSIQQQTAQNDDKSRVRQSLLPLTLKKKGEQLSPINRQNLWNSPIRSLPNQTNSKLSRMPCRQNIKDNRQRMIQKHSQSNNSSGQLQSSQMGDQNLPSQRLQKDSAQYQQVSLNNKKKVSLGTLGTVGSSIYTKSKPLIVSRQFDANYSKKQLKLHEAIQQSQRKASDRGVQDKKLNVLSNHGLLTPDSELVSGPERLVSKQPENKNTIKSLSPTLGVLVSKSVDSQNKQKQTNNINTSKNKATNNTQHMVSRTHSPTFNTNEQVLHHSNQMSNQSTKKNKNQEPTNKEGVGKNNRHDNTKTQKKQQEPNQIGQNSKIGSNKNTKVKPGKVSTDQLSQYILSKDIQAHYRRVYESEKAGNWKAIIKSHVSFLTEFYVNDELAAFGICQPLPVPADSIIIRYWAPIQKKCTTESCQTLFKGYLEYIEKYTTSTCIYHKGEPYDLLLNNNFVEKKNQVFQRRRVSQITKEKSAFSSFLSIELSCIEFQQHDSESHSLLYSEQIQPFSIQNFGGNKFFLQSKQQFVTQELASQKITNLEQIVQFRGGASAISEINRLLEQKDCDTYEVNQEIQIKNINMILMKLNSSLKCNFCTEDYFIKFPATLNNPEAISKDKFIYQVEFVHHKVSCFFGSGLGYNSAQQFSRNIQRQIYKSNLKKQEICVKMFSKQLYGQIKTQLSSRKGLYANWEVNLIWEPELHGKIKVSLQGVTKFGSEPFFMAIFIGKVYLLSIQITSEDCIH